MKSRIMFISLCYFGFIFSNQFCCAQKGSFIDLRDGKSYKTIQIGLQTWMAENLAYTPSISTVNNYRNPVRNGIYCYNDDTTLLKEYGALYSWDVAYISCPVGWHLPTKYDYDTLIAQYTGSDSKSAWEALNIGGISGFEAKFGGFLFDGFRYETIGKGGNYWTSTRVKREWYYQLFIDFSGRCELTKVPKLSYKRGRTNALSVRCIKD